MSVSQSGTAGRGPIFKPNFSSVFGRVLAALWLCLAAASVSILLGAASPVLAQSGSPWHVDSSVPSLSNGNTYVLWVKDGTTDAQGNYSGDTASIWTVDASGRQMAISPTYGPYAGWRTDQLTPAFDGTLRMAWTMNSGSGFLEQRSVVSIWTLDSSANRASVSPTYGPYAGWHFQEMFPNPDGTTALYWLKPIFDSSQNFSSTQLSIWAVDSVGSQLTISPTYGPYPGWFFLEGVPSLNKDGTSFVVWFNPDLSNSDTYAGDQLSVWKTDSRGNQTSIGPTYGRYPGWRFRELYPAYDGTARLLWSYDGTTDANDNYSGDTASVWSMDATGHQTSISPTYGPYPGWTVDSVIAAPSSTSRLLWVLPGTTNSSGNFTGDQVSIWSLNSSNVQTSISPTYTSPGGQVLDSLSVHSDGSEHLEWEYSGIYPDGQFSIWALDASNNRTVTGPVYGPYR